MKILKKANFSFILVTLLCISIFLFYGWTASNGLLIAFKPFKVITHNMLEFHSLLADAFLHGQTALLNNPLPQLLALPNPYDPVANAFLQLHDASLYQGKYYLYFTPLVALFILTPIKALTGYFLPQALVSPLLCYIGFLASFNVFQKILNTNNIRLNIWTNIGCILALALLTAIPFLLRRCFVYEVCIAAAYAMLMLALYYFVKTLKPSQKILSQSFMFGLFLGLTILARPSQILTCFILGLALLGLRLMYFHDQWVKIIKIALTISIPVVCIVSGMLYYNFVRFGSPFEFGLSYQLTAFNVRETHTLALFYLPYGIYNYLFHLPTVNFSFPYIHAISSSYPAQINTPHYVYNAEPLIGLFGFPFFLLYIPILPYLKKIFHSYKLLTLFALCFLFSGILSLLGASIICGNSMRYMVDFLPLFLISLLLLYIAFLDLLQAQSKKIMLKIGYLLFGVTLTISAIISLCTSITGESDSLKLNNPALYMKLRAWLPFYKLYPHHYTLQILITPTFPTLEPIMYIGGSGAGDLIFLEHKNVHMVRIGIDHWGVPVIMSPWIDAQKIYNALWHIQIQQSKLSLSVGTLHLESVPTQLTRPVFGKNDIGFSSVSPKAKSIIQVIDQHF